MNTDEENLLIRYIEAQMGGEVTGLVRQARWRKAWFAELTRGGVVIPLYIRGDKQLDAEPFPGLAREAAILRQLEADGILVPHVHGVCPEPLAIVMERLPGVREVERAANDAQRQSIAEQYVAQLARMHALDVGPFVAAGIGLPADPRGNVLAYLDANQPLYDRGKRKPQPFVEFALRWARRNAPTDRPRSSFIHCDVGQFLFVEGKITGIYDFEASHIGDPLADLASLRTRDGFEPLGADVSHLVRHYQQLTGETIDPWALSFHTFTFSLTSVMALSGPLSEPDAHRVELEYLIWYLMTRRAAIWAMAECLGLQLTPSPALPPQPTRQSLLLNVLGQTVARGPAETAMEQRHRQSAITLAQWAVQADAQSSAADQRERASLARFIEPVPLAWDDADAALERFVLQAGPEHDHALLLHFAQQLEDEISMAEPLRERLAGYALKPVVL